jgi:hypothetical protein
MARKPDVFERMVTQLRLEHMASPWSTQIPMAAWPTIEHRVAELLRRYHARVRRLVQNIDAVIDSSYGHGRYNVREELLEKLDNLKKRG